MCERGGCVGMAVRGNVDVLDFRITVPIITTVLSFSDPILPFIFFSLTSFNPLFPL